MVSHMPQTHTKQRLIQAMGSCSLALFACQAPTFEVDCASGVNDAPFQSQETGLVFAQPDDPAAALYSPDLMPTFELQISEENLAFLDNEPAAEIYVPGTLIYEGEEIPNVGIRYKGSVGAFVGCTANSTDENPFDTSGAKICPKLSMKVSFNEYNPDGRFMGLKKLLFHSMNQDESLMRERMGYHLFREMGIAAPRANHMRLRINGEFAGVFLNLEQIDGRFTRSRFADGQGNLYKEVWPTYSPLQPKTTERALHDSLKSNRDENPSVQKMLDFGEAVMQSDSESAIAAIDEWMSVEYMARWIAVDRTIRADDGAFHFYCEAWGDCGNHNFYVYEEEEAERLWVIPWDLDNAFVVLGPDATGADLFLHIQSEWNDTSTLCKPQAGAADWAPLQMPPACDPLFNRMACGYQTPYEEAVRTFLEGPFHTAETQPLLDQWTAQITEAVAEAHGQNGKQLSVDEWGKALTDFQNRLEVLREEAENP